jgi:hypothetical protein
LGRKPYKGQEAPSSGTQASLRGTDAPLERGANGLETGGYAGLLAARIERLALEELDAARRRGWEDARRKALERSRLREEYHRLNTRRLA